jgi:hypothetical protein
MLEEEHDAGAAADGLAEARDVLRAAGHREHQDLDAGLDEPVDLRGRALPEGVGPGEQRRVADGLPQRRQAALAVPGQPQAQAALALGLAPRLEVGADPVDPGRGGPAGERRAVAEQGERDVPAG